PKGAYEERIETFARLLRMEDTRDYDPLLTGRAASSPDPWLRAKTALAVGRLHDRDATVYLPVFLRDEDRGVRRAAAFACGISGDARLVRFLVKALQDDDPEVLANGTEALSRLGDAGATAALVEAASSVGEGRRAAARALWRFPSAGNVGVVAPLLSSPAL